jgi:hypothetical protein
MSCCVFLSVRTLMRKRRDDEKKEEEGKKI